MKIESQSCFGGRIVNVCHDVVKCLMSPFALSMVSRHQSGKSGEGQLPAVKNILKYLRNTKDMFLVYGREEELRDRGMRCWTWIKFKARYRGDPCESEYIAACEASKEAIWMKNFIGDLRVVPTSKDPIEIFYDNESLKKGTRDCEAIRSEDNPDDSIHKASSEVALDGTLFLVNQDRLRPIIVDDVSKWETIRFSVQAHN
ncbi:hypothetical protein Tco_0683048 [Tanacetum coccineum]|uniref:Uncharacterized protein n=1 Tax=Tanacetum coccineum TaxID=301880 RepID=A0ABQ4XUB2_9ASTR